MKEVALVLGAGFNADISRGTPLRSGGLRYPLLADLLRECFGLEELPKGRSIEELFQESIRLGDPEPLRLLARLLMEADYFLTPHLLPKSGPNPYLDLLTRFPTAPILTFNYDGLAEILALHLGQWRPEDGFGVPVEVLPQEGDSATRAGSSREILHLHGSLYVYPIEVEVVAGGLGRFDLMRRRPEPQYVFEPNTVAHRFLPFRGPGVVSPFEHPPERFLAPVPEKAEEGLSVFVEAMRKRARLVLGEAGLVVAIGYSFNAVDRDSYAELFQGIPSLRVLVVAPEADQLVRRLGSEFPDVEWTAAPTTFRDWCATGFQGTRMQARGEI